MGVERIDARFAALRSENRAGFIAYTMAGDPDLETAYKIFSGLAQAGADMIELGFPFSDPMAEGPTIQLAAERALKAGTKIKDVFDMVARFRQTDQATPVILMGYMNPVASMGVKAWAERMKAAGVDGLIVVDCPPEEADDLSDALEAHNLALIRLATPTSDAHRLKTLVKRTSGFIYYVSVAGVTGVKSVNADAIKGAVSQVREAGGLPVCVGFGIKTPEAAAEVARIADAAVVGSALVEEIRAHLPDVNLACAKVLEKAAILAQSVRSARQKD
jgi:tryptophan synthase alpha chain